MVSSAPSDPGSATEPIPQRVLLITGMSGAGKTSALKALEDIGYDTVDHLPLSLLPRLVTPTDSHLADEAAGRPLAVGIDVRTRDFRVDAVLREVDHLVTMGAGEVRLLFLDCDDEQLRRRYTETRHRHPLAADRPVADGIDLERRLMFPLRAHADMVIDTSGLRLGSLKRILESHFGVDRKPELSVFVTSFSYRLGLPREADLVFDVRFLANPHYDPVLRDKTGLDEPVAQYIERDEGLMPFLDALTRLIAPLLPRYTAEGKSYLTIGVGCTGGRHRSVFVAHALASRLQALGFSAQARHRDVTRRTAPVEAGQ
ncbi:MAG: RNase adapter RapZ [Rhodospirillales bacterium]|nr:MAG: RNase adapter RapZ [Rhodospirillales bacterium]